MEDKKHYIYILQNKLNLKIYVGYSSNCEKRWKYHKSTAFSQCNIERYKPLYEAIRQDGWDNFSKEIIEEFENSNEALRAEQFWIEFFDLIN